jgi:glyoxylase-like metal-dependent hydrolase (beta-lactamase superfamily II)
VSSSALVPISAQVAYLPGANNLGVIRAPEGAIAVDTGIDKDTGRTLRKAIEAAGHALRAIITTHHHADHVGGNDYLLRNLPGIAVYATRGEAPLIEHPLLEPIYLHHGAAPPAALRTKWLMSAGSPIHHHIAPGPLALLGTELEIIGVPGHSIDQIAVAVDGVCLAADGFFGPGVLARHGIPYAHDVQAQLASLDALAATDYATYLPAHGTLLTRAELPAVLAANRAAIERGMAAVLAALAEPGSVEAVVARTLTSIGHSVAGLPQYAIFASVVAAHLTELERQGRAQVELGPFGPLWHRAV